ncbi:5360825e-7567-4f80-8b47-f45328dfde8c [Sclerotinia trifoliorum]|uniref:5360825e-7567-4f80-8b47-f45328dfde8c n=1 Tax=Sclerotinia trifoliorum TaxID=28548 RepID=A0A8H2ZNM3_9HELO|nr:5360825e-7567-4f80-8b47-f45328dfde8c [Sclerotinia trifoliorum]
MHFLLLGASGRTGSLVLAEALSKNHTVTALARNPSSIPATPGLTIVKGTPSSSDDLATAFTSGPKIDAVLVTLSSSRASDSPFAASTSPPNFLQKTISTVTESMLAHGVRKIIYMSAFGVGSSNGALWFPMRMLINNSTMGKVGFQDHAAAEEVLRQSGLEYGVVRSAMLKEGGKKKIVEHGADGKGMGHLPGCTRESVAGYMVEMAERKNWENKVVVICN